MKQVSELYKLIKDPSFNKSQFETSEDMKKILFVDPIMMNFDFYTIILPYLALPSSDQVLCAMTGMYRYGELETKPKTFISEFEIMWADVIVFPMTIEQFGLPGDLFDEIRRTNPRIKIIMTCEFDFYSMTLDHYLLNSNLVRDRLIAGGKKGTAKEVSDAQKEMRTEIVSHLEINFKSVDRILVLNPNLMEKLQKKGFSDVKYMPILTHRPLFIENINFEETLAIKNTPGIVYLSLDLNKDTSSAFSEYVDVLAECYKNHGDKFRIVIIGDHPEKHIESLPFEFVHLETPSLVHHFKTIVKSSADIHLHLNKMNEYSSHTDSVYVFIERALFGIPLVALNHEPLNKLVIDKETGYLISKRNDLISLVDSLINGDKTELVELSSQLKNKVTDMSAYTDENVVTLANIFVGEFNSNNE